VDPTAKYPEDDPRYEGGRRHYVETQKKLDIEYQNEAQKSKVERRPESKINYKELFKSPVMTRPFDVTKSPTGRMDSDLRWHTSEELVAPRQELNTGHLGLEEPMIVTGGVINADQIINGPVDLASDQYIMPNPSVEKPEKVSPLLKLEIVRFFANMEHCKKVLLLEVVFGVKDLENSKEAKKEVLKQLESTEGCQKLLDYFMENRYSRGVVGTGESIYADPMFDDVQEKPVSFKKFFLSDVMPVPEENSDSTPDESTEEIEDDPEMEDDGPSSRYLDLWRSDK
jgi:hypothetical protein